jgi:outer membrane immunogenic protein
MRSMLLSLVLIGAPTLVAAQELPANNWSGLYIGLNGGYGWGDTDVQHPTEFDGGAIFNYRSFQSDDEGWLGGGQVGYNFQRGQFIFGAEADLQGTDIHTHKIFRRSIFEDAGSSFNTVAEAELETFGTVRGRLGYAFNEVFMLYATGGYAWGDVESKLSFPNADGTPNPFHDKDGDTTDGFAVGGGAEWMLARNFTARIEYMHLELDDDKRFLIAGDTYKWDEEIQVDLIRVGINYKFGALYEPQLK